MDRVAKSARTRAGAKAPAARKAQPPVAADARTTEQRLADALAQQAATAEILRVMAASPTDMQPVIDAVAEQAARLCRAPFARVLLVEGNAMRPAAQFQTNGGPAPSVHTVPLSRTSISGRAVLDRATVHHADIVPLLDREFPDARENARATGFRATLAVPLIHEGAAHGAIFVWRREPGLFPPDQVALLETFARQAAIAIGNTRLSHATKEALEQQTATAEILRAIARSASDTGPVLQTLVESAVRLCQADSGTITRQKDGRFYRAEAYGYSREFADFVKDIPVQPERGSATGRALLEGRVVHIPDVNADPDYTFTEAQRLGDFRSIVSVPMMREGVPIGVLALTRSEVRPFDDKQIELLSSFADQAVIAIENVRLFSELEARNRDLSEALEQQTATSGILRAISRSPTDVQPVFDNIAAAALNLCGAASALVTRLDGESIVLVASANLTEEGAQAMREAFPMPIGRQATSARAIREARMILIPDVIEDPDYKIQELALRAAFRSTLAVPLMREGRPVGTITVGKAEPGPFSDSQVALLETFADQAVIAIENVRLFTELEARNRSLTETLEQQMATGEILRVIARSPTDTQPVFDLLAKHAAILCEAEVAVVSRFDGARIELAASGGLSPEAVAIVRSVYPMDIDAETFTSRTIRGGEVVHVADVQADATYGLQDFARAARYRSGLCVPIVHQGQVIGSIFVGRSRTGLFADSQVDLLKTFADQAVIAIENVRLFTELEARNRDITEALEQQTATSEILRVISQSQTDVQPVFRTIATAALGLCRATSAVVATYDGALIRVGAVASVTAEGAEEIRAIFPRPASRDNGVTRAVLTRALVTIPDVLADDEYRTAGHSLASGFRSILAVPLLRDGQPIGAISLGRSEPGVFPDAQVALLQTFADQAVIAIENVRLFAELEGRNRDLTEALEQQTATSEILRVISRSRTDVQPVFDTIAQAALDLCGGVSANVFTFDGELVHVASIVNANAGYAKALREFFPRPPSRDTAVLRAILTGSVTSVSDVLADREYVIGEHSAAGGFRSVLAVPLLNDGTPVGGIAVGRSAPGPFPETQVALLQTFADQAVIAIENVRLFNELGIRNRDLTTALEQQTATSEILRVISQSQTDVQPVFDTIVCSVRTLCDAAFSGVYLLEAQVLDLAAADGMPPEELAVFRSEYPRPIGPDTVSGRAALECRVVQTPDLPADPDYRDAPGSRIGARTVLAVPLLRDGRAIGSIGVWRSEVNLFSDTQIALLQTFADQAVIAIENVRLFRELEARTAALTRSVGELRALGEVGQAVSSTLDLETVLSTIVSRATQLTGMDGGSIYEYDEGREEFYLRTAERLPDELVAALRATPMRKGEGALGRMAVTGEPVAIGDIRDETAYQSRVRKILMRVGFRSLLAVPLVRDNRILGGIAVNRKAPGAFAPDVIALLQTFAAQSALAIQNARLFREIEEKGRQLETASRHKSEFLANMSHELRTPLNAIIGFSEVLAERMFGEINDKQAEYLDDIVVSGRHLLALINDILDLSKIEAGRMELDLSEFELAAVIANTLALVRERAQRRGIALASAVDPRIGAVRADERKVKQVLLNLLSNALKFTPEGGAIDVRASLARDGVEIAVTDTGVGISPEDQATVFEEFRQVGAAAKKVEGTGLGLAISRKFVELHGGAIRVASVPGKGSTFTFTLPR